MCYFSYVCFFFGYVINFGLIYHFSCYCGISAKTFCKGAWTYCMINPLTASLIVHELLYCDECLRFIFPVSCHGFMARLKAFLPRLNSGRAGIVDLNPSTEYVKPFNQEINAKHEDRCYYKADQSVWLRWRLIGFVSVLWMLFQAFDAHVSSCSTKLTFYNHLSLF